MQTENILTINAVTYGGVTEFQVVNASTKEVTYIATHEEVRLADLIAKALADYNQPRI